MWKARKFKSWATRDTSDNKYDYDRFMCPLVLQRFAEYMQKNRIQSDWNLRDPDNWKKWIPIDAYMSSMMRHVHDTWMEHDWFKSREWLEEALCWTMFNAMGYLHEILKKNN